MARLRQTRCTGACLLFILLSTGAFAAGDGGATASGLRGGLSALDWGVVVVYAAAMLAIGFYYARRMKTSEEYYLGGRKMKPSMVGLSLFATLLSTISYLAVPGELMKHGPIALLNVVALPVVFVIVGYLLIPFIMRLPITSAYEILETKFGRPTRLFGSAVFLLIRLVWMGLVVFTASKVIVPAIGLSPDKIPYVIVVLGAVTVIYSSMGGLQAVVLTDTIQTFILFVGAVVCVVIITVRMGGVGWFPTEWSPNWDTQPLFSFDPTVRVTMVGMVGMGIVWWICTAGSDQMAIQRYLATRDAKAARTAFLINCIADVLVTIVLGLLGFALLGFFLANPQYQLGELNLERDADSLFPYFIVNFMGYGMAGLVISGLLAAAMSSLSSGVNSGATVVNTDFLDYFLGEGATEEKKVRMAKWTSVVIGVLVILLGIVEGKIPGNLFEVTQKTNGLFVAPLFGLFFFAMFVPFATGFGAVWGSIYGFVAAFLVAFWDLTGGPALSFTWIYPVSLIVNIAVGCGLSLIPMRDKSRAYKTAVSAVCAVPLVAVGCAFTWACFAGNP